MIVRDRLHPLDDVYAGIHPKDRQQPHGWDGVAPIFERLVAEVSPRRIIEVGTWLGASAITMAEHAAKLDHPCEIVCVDTFLGGNEHYGKTHFRRLLEMRNGRPTLYDRFLQHVVSWGHQDRITPFVQTSVEAARWFVREAMEADLIYIDGSHEHEDVVADLASWRAVLRTGGTMFGHDYTENWPGVVAAVDDALPERTVEAPFWIWRKP